MSLSTQQEGLRWAVAGEEEERTIKCFSLSSDFDFGQITAGSTGQVCVFSLSFASFLSLFEFGRSEREVEGVYLLGADGSRQRVQGGCQRETLSPLLISNSPSA